MDNYFSKEVLQGLEAAKKRALKSSNRLCVHMGENVYPVTKTWENGFAMRASDDANLRGLVDVFDGPRHLHQCLIVCAEQQFDEVHYEYKRATEADSQPPVDFVRATDAPIALLGK